MLFVVQLAIRSKDGGDPPFKDGGDNAMDLLTLPGRSGPISSDAL